MSTELVVQSEPFQALVDECKAIITETIFASRWALVEGYHALGERIQTDEGWQKYAKGNTDACKTLAKNIGISDRTLYYAIQFYDKYPKLDLVPEGKNISWSKVITKYLPKVAREPSTKPSYLDLHEMIKDINYLMKTEFEKENQRVVAGEIAINKSNCEFIRYLQDQINKITGGIDNDEYGGGDITISKSGYCKDYKRKQVIAKVVSADTPSLPLTT